MSTRVITRLLLFLALAFLQCLILCQIRLLGYCTPLLAVYYLALTPSQQSRCISLLEAFLLGLCMDVSLNTPGMAAAALTLTAFVNPYILSLTSDPERPDEEFTPSSVEMGWGAFLLYAGLLTLVFATSYFLIEWFTFKHMRGLLLCILGSTALTLLLIAVVEQIHRKMLSGAKS